MQAKLIQAAPPARLKLHEANKAGSTCQVNIMNEVVCGLFVLAVAYITGLSM